MFDIINFSQFVFTCLYFFLPAYLANMVPPLAARIFKDLNAPVDGGLKLKNHYLFGSHKTWRGVASAIITGMAVITAQSWLAANFETFRNVSLIDYGKHNILLLGFLMSASVMTGDLASAFIKRRLDIKPGGKFIPWDQTNYVIGNYIFVEPYLHLGLTVWLTLFIATFFIHLAANRIGYELGIHKAKW
ncbi:MAG: CDP-archaeol synthase [Candidatus Paceibacterota bacterium]|jgi:CDP-2,3-bis-(O-geranylgeranyl)-sn-glycerol synthase